MELFCSDACCNENYLDPLQHNEPGRVGQYDRPPECPTSHSSSIELREVGSGQPVQRLSRHGVYADANNNNTTPEGVVARVLESFTDQDRHTPFRGTRNYVPQLSLHSSGDWDPGDGSHLSDRSACVLESFTDQDRLKYYDTNGKTGLGSTPRRARIYGG